MSRIEDLIAELCPDGVKYKRLDEVCEITRGRVMSKDYLRDNAGKFPVYSSQTTNNGVFGFINNYDYDCESITWTTDGANAGSVFYHINEKFSITNVCGLLKVIKQNAINTRFLYYCLQIVAKDYVNSGMGNPKLMSNVMARVIVPVPPLPVQQEIVHILDKFTALEAELEVELEAELEARKKQYEYYRGELLAFGDEVRWTPLCDIADIGTGSSNTNEELEVGKYPFFVRSQEVRHMNAYEYDETAIITSGDGVGVGKIFHYVEGKYALHQRAYRIHIKDSSILPKYFFYYMKSAFLPYIEKNSFHSSVTSIRRPMLNNFPVPVPSLTEQQRIVAILDRFDILVNDITQGLPAEIEARRKQYEYYRDKLLTFKEKVS